MKVGLLMEAAETQRALAAAALEQLREHAAGLDGIVREEIRSTLIEELGALDEDSRRAAESLRALKQAASLRLAAWSVGVAALSAAIPLTIGWWLLPSHAEVAARRASTGAGRGPSRAAGPSARPPAAGGRCLRP